MFSEELSCNSGRKKAEENRARRKRIQQQQQQKQQQSLYNASSTSQTVNLKKNPIPSTNEKVAHKDLAALQTTATNDRILSTALEATAEEAVVVSETNNPPVQSIVTGASGVHNDEYDTDKKDSTNVANGTNKADNSNDTNKKDNKDSKDNNGNRDRGDSSAIESSVTPSLSNLSAPSSAMASVVGGIHFATPAVLGSSALERAKHERRARAARNLQLDSAVVLQSWYRQIRVQQSTLCRLSQQLLRQLSDLDKLRTLLSKKQPFFVPPVSTTNSLMRILIFLSLIVPNTKFNNTCSTSLNAPLVMRQSMQVTPLLLQCLYQIIDLCLIPGLKGNQSNNSNNSNNNNNNKDNNNGNTNNNTYNSNSNKNNAVLLWIDNKEDQWHQGKFRFHCLMRLISIALVHPTSCSAYTNGNGHQSRGLDIILKLVSSMLQPQISVVDNDKDQQEHNSLLMIQRTCQSAIFSIERGFVMPTKVWPFPSNVVQTSVAQSLTESTSSSKNSKNITVATSLALSTFDGDENCKDQDQNRTLTTTTTNANTSTSTFSCISFTNTGDDDWFLLIRHYLLFYQRQTSHQQGQNTAYSKNNNVGNINSRNELYRPIPNDCVLKREESFPILERYRANRLIQLLLESITTYKHDSNDSSTHINGTLNKLNKYSAPKASIRSVLQSKFVTHILTIPLFTWRVIQLSPPQQLTSNGTINTTDHSIDSLAYLLSPSKTSSNSLRISDQQLIPLSPRIIEILHSFVRVNAESFNRGLHGGKSKTNRNEQSAAARSDGIVTILPTDDVPMTVCPVTPAQCLLANLVQLGRLCPALNPQPQKPFSFRSTALFMDVLSLLLDGGGGTITGITTPNNVTNNVTVPLSTFATRESSTAVEWIEDGRGHWKPIILSNVVLEQCKGLLVDSYVRRLFLAAMDCDGSASLKHTIEETLKRRNENDIKHEQDMDGASQTSAASLAAKEARVDRNTNFWNTSKWAKQLTRGVSTLLSNTTTSTAPADTHSSSLNGSSIRNRHKQNHINMSTATGGPNLHDTSSVSRQLAEGESNQFSTSTLSSSLSASSSETFTLDLLLSLCRMYSILLARWGGSGNYDLVDGSTKSHSLSADSVKMRKTAITANSKNGRSSSDVATSRPEPFTLSLLNVLCFSTPIVRTLWGLIQHEPHNDNSNNNNNNNNNNKHTNNAFNHHITNKIVSEVRAIVNPDHSDIRVKEQSIRPIFTDQHPSLQLEERQQQQYGRIASNNDGSVVLYFFLCTFAHVLIITDDVEIHDMDKPLPIHQIRRCVMLLKQLLYRAACLDVAQNFNSNHTAKNHSTVHLSSSLGDDTNLEFCTDTGANYFGYSLIAASSRTMKDLYDRSSRRPFCLPSMWTISKLLDKEVGRCKTCNDYLTLLATTPVLRVFPFLVSFKRRLKLFEQIISTNRVEVQGENSANPFHTNPLKPGIPIRITRGRILEDGLITMNNLGPTMLRQRLQVIYYNETGLRETGIDAGGLFKDFWTDLCAIAFNPNYALFRVTEAVTGSAGNCLYPNPLSAAVHGSSEHIVLFEFLGRILGKALYEGITINPRFAHFFLSFLRGDYNFLHMLPDLSTVDPQLYNNLMFLKNFDGDCSDLCLTFTVSTDEFGGTKEIPLIPNGGNVDVTNDNKQRYIGLVAKHYVFDRVKEQSEAFTRGLWDVLDPMWLRLFNEPELQVLISGVAEGKLDLEDMKAHVQYAGGYSSVDGTIRRFWNVVAGLTTKQQGQLLRFVTGCERPPPLGFASMNPPFTIQRVSTSSAATTAGAVVGGGLNLLRGAIGVGGDGDRLPSASTCFNILKLPCYSSEKILKERLIYAIESGAGFELS